MDRLGFRTKEQFGNALGCTHGLVSQWSSGKTRPSYDMCRKLLELGATVEELFGVDCRGSCPHAAQEPEPSGMPDWARRMEARLERLEQARAKANAG